MLPRPSPWAATLLGLLCAIAQAPPAPAPEPDLATQLGPTFAAHDTPHFTLYTDGKGDDAVTDTLEQLYASVYRRLDAMGLHPAAPTQRLACILFDRRADFIAFVRRQEKIALTWNDGFFAARSTRVYLCQGREHDYLAPLRDTLAAADAEQQRLRTRVEQADPVERKRLGLLIGALRLQRDLLQRGFDLNARAATLGIARHEATHQLLQTSGLLRADRTYPFWIDEGLACYFELHEGLATTRPSLAGSGRLALYRKLEADKRLRPLNGLLLRRPGTTEKGSTVDEEYAQAWALTHFVITRHPEPLAAYLRELTDAPPARDEPALFRKHFPDPAAIETEWREYMKKL